MRAGALLGLALAACVGERPAGLRPAEPGPGPTVVFDIDARPLPEIPLPNDLATRPDPGSPTGRRVNLSLEAPTALERSIRRTAQSLEGFGTYAPISVRFTAPLDLDEIVRRHRSNRDFADDAVLLVCLQRGPHFGELVPLDFGHGNFPLTLPDLDAYWDNDPRRDVANLLFDTTSEDRNGNGQLDPGEDTDGDGWLDRPNVYPPGADPIDGLLTFYERATNTLIFRPMVPLEQESLYAVVLTRHLVGTDGNPVRSPFPWIHHTRQTRQLADLGRALRRSGRSLEDVAFTWAFTTQGPTRDLEALRRGLYGAGPFARLEREFPPQLVARPGLSEGPNRYAVPASLLRQLGPLVRAVFGGSEASVNALVASYDNVDYVVVGEVEGPNLLADRDGIAAPGYPADNDEVWEIDRRSGRAFYARHRIPFLCVVPRKDRGSGPPFPVAIYGHGYQSTRVELLAFAGNIARYGIATCGIDAFGHGLVVPAELREIADAVVAAFHIEPLWASLVPGRARDLNNDGVPDPGNDFFTADLFHTRDMVRQSVLDQMVLIRALRALDGRRTAGVDHDGDGRIDLAGDFDGDGVVDFGSPSVDYFAWGTSMGGIMTGVLAGIEPALVAAAPSAGGGGLTDIPLRTTQGGVPEGAILRLLGPIFVGEPAGSPGTVAISAIVASGNRAEKRLVAPEVPVRAGDRVEIENPRNGKRFEAFARDDGSFRLHIAADALDATTKRALLGLRAGAPPPVAPDVLALGDPLVIRIHDGPAGAVRRVIDRFEADVVFEGVTFPRGAPLVAIAQGFGLQRNTPDLRRFAAMAQTMIEAGDPINYAPHYFRDPLPSLDYDLAEPGTNVLVIATAGDTNVPISTGIALARAAGLIDLFTPDPRYGKTVNEVLIDHHVVEGLSWLRRFDGQRVLMDVEDFSRGVHAPHAPRLRPPLRLTKATGKGLQAIRIPLLDPRGQHGFGLPDPTAVFDNHTFLVHMVGRFFATRGREIPDDPCMATASCPWMPPVAERGE